MFKSSVIIALMLLFTCSESYAQKNNLNSYKYIVVPSQYEFQKSEDAYQVNSLTAFLFNRAGYTVFLSSDSYPAELANNSCSALKAIVVNNSGMLSTKMQIKLVDCYNNVVFLTDEVTSKEKDYKKAYHEAIRKAFVELEELNYQYDQPKVETPQEVKIVENVQNRPIVKEVVNAIDDIQVKSELTADKKVEKIKVEGEYIENVVEKKKTIIKPIQEEIKEIEIKPTIFSLEGKYEVEKWGVCTISKNEEGYSFKGGDENFEFAVLYKTSKPTIFIIKYAAFKQPQLVEITKEGNLKIDADNAVKIYKRVN